LSRKESADLIEAYYQSYPRLKIIKNKLNYENDVQTILGRRRYLKDINSQMQWCVAVQSEMQSTPLYKEVLLTLLK
jgi:DNA polymerase I-like protein with 3'-5' exonuclease and polymerase domains